MTVGMMAEEYTAKLEILQGEPGLTTQALENDMSKAFPTQFSEGLLSDHTTLWTE